MSSMDDFNNRLPSSADSLDNVQETLSDKVSAGKDTVLEAAAEAGERAGEVYQRGNDIIANRIDPLVGITLAAVAGFFVGYMVGTDHRRY